jgi:hypothetical protein
MSVDNVLTPTPKAARRFLDFFTPPINFPIWAGVRFPRGFIRFCIAPLPDRQLVLICSREKRVQARILVKTSHPS